MALTMKLSEAKFQPLFLRLLDWASTAHAGSTGAQPGLPAVMSHTPAAASEPPLPDPVLPPVRRFLRHIPALALSMARGSTALEIQSFKLQLRCLIVPDLPYCPCLQRHCPWAGRPPCSMWCAP